MTDAKVCRLLQSDWAAVKILGWDLCGLTNYKAITLRILVPSILSVTVCYANNRKMQPGRKEKQAENSQAAERLTSSDKNMTCSPPSVWNPPPH
jgi:hypothetical protein